MFSQVPPTPYHKTGHVLQAPPASCSVSTMEETYSLWVHGLPLVMGGWGRTGHGVRLLCRLSLGSSAVLAVMTFWLTFQAPSPCAVNHTHITTIRDALWLIACIHCGTQPVLGLSPH